MKKTAKFSTKETLILGAALFAMFFGAGNVIFPPSIGLNNGSSWFIGASLFIASSMGVAFLGIIATVKIRGKFNTIMERVSPKFTKTFMLTLLLVMGPLFIVPRTAALAYELGLGSVIKGFGGNIESLGDIAGVLNILFASFYVIMVLIVIFKPSKIIDVIGKYLTPVLITILLTIIIAAVVNPIHEVKSGGSSSFDSAINGFKAGYQTMDGIGIIVLAPLLISSIVSKKQDIEQKELGSVLIKATLIAITGITIIYFGMALVGSQLYDNVTEATHPDLGWTNGSPSLSLLVDYIAFKVLGPFGRIIFGSAVILACYTTAIAFISVPANYVADHTWEKRYSYKQWSVVFAAITALLAVIGVDGLVVLFGPILEILFPVAISIYLLAFISTRTDISIVFVSSIYTALVMGAVQGFASNVVEFQDIVDRIPLGDIGMVWFLPTLGVFLVTFFAFEVIGIDKEEQGERNKKLGKARRAMPVDKKNKK